MTASSASSQQGNTGKVFLKHWPQAVNPTFRVFFVTSLERLGNIAKAIAAMPGAGAVRLTTVADLVPERLLTDQISRTVMGECLPILPPGRRAGS